MTFAPEYVRHVLQENFEDAKALFLEPLLAIHRAHLVMLAEQRIVPRDDARSLRAALRGLSPEAIRAADYDARCEDLFFHVEQLIAQAAGEDVAGRLHTARSRNDIDMTMYRMQQREWVLALSAAVLELRSVLLTVADAHRHTLFPAHTHTQPAQPTTLAHYVMALVEELERSTARLRHAFATTNHSPLGACAITGTSFPIDRRRTSDLLGFAGPTGNTYGSIATVDYMLENLSAAVVVLIGVGRFVQDLLLWATAEVGYLRLADGFVQCSSIMPQKRNPVALEHARSIGSRAIGQAAAALLSVHNTPYGDTVDTEDDLQPVIRAAFHDSVRTIGLVAASLEHATFDVALMRRRAGESWTTATELADTLAREQQLPFREAHSIAAGLIRAHRAAPEAPLAETLHDISQTVAGRTVEYDEARLREVLSPEYFVRIRRTHGGPAPEMVANAVTVSREVLDGDRAWLRERRARLTDAARLLENALEQL